MSFDYNTVINTCWYSISGALIAGIFGFFIGKILETSNSSSKKNRYKSSKKSAKKELADKTENIDEN